MRKTIFVFCAAAVLVPYVTTLAWSGGKKTGGAGAVAASGLAGGAGNSAVTGNAGGTGIFAGAENAAGANAAAPAQRFVILDRGAGGESQVDVEEYLIGLVACQIPAEYELETIKAQAVLARTHIYKQMGASGAVMESALDVDYEEPQNLGVEVYRRICEAVQATRGLVIRYDGELIDPLFHRVSAGSTREGGALRPYLQPAECENDYASPDFLHEFSWTKEELAVKLNGITGAAGGMTVRPEELPQVMQVAEKDGAGYVTAMQIGAAIFTGEEVQFALGLPSSCYVFGEEDGRVTCTVKGSGHGYGFDQYGANERAKEGWSFEELIHFFFENIVLISE